MLTHTSNGIYTGTITLEEDLAESGMGSFFVETAYNAGNEGRYSPATDKEIVQPNAPLNVGRYNSGALSISAPVGTWEITFDWSKGIVSIEKPAVGEIHVSDKGMATYYNKVGYTMPEGLRGATVSLKRTTDYGYIVEPNWKYAAGDAVPAGEALLIEGAEGTYTARQNEGSEAPTAGNLLHGEFTEGTGANAGQFFTAYNDGKDNLFYKLTTKDGLHEQQRPRIPRRGESRGRECKELHALRYRRYRQGGRQHIRKRHNVRPQRTPCGEGHKGYLHCKRQEDCSEMTETFCPGSRPSDVSRDGTRAKVKY